MLASTIQFSNTPRTPRPQETHQTTTTHPTRTPPHQGEEPEPGNQGSDAMCAQASNPPKDTTSPRKPTPHNRGEAVPGDRGCPFRTQQCADTPTPTQEAPRPEGQDTTAREAGRFHEEEVCGVPPMSTIQDHGRTLKMTCAPTTPPDRVRSSGEDHHWGDPATNGDGKRGSSLERR
jgi:hypothetical protein